VEDKGLAIALHYRNATPDAAERLARAAADCLQQSSGLALLRGKKVLEILPAVPWNKGECARWTRAAVVDAAADVTTLSVGDDETDELAFDALASQAVTVRVGPNGAPSRAGHRLAAVADVQRLFSALAAQTGTSA
jgi:trehalose 6-phosphate phosphatase